MDKERSRNARNEHVRGERLPQPPSNKRSGEELKELNRDYFSMMANLVKNHPKTRDQEGIKDLSVEELTEQSLERYVDFIDEEGKRVEALGEARFESFGMISTHPKEKEDER